MTEYLAGEMWLKLGLSVVCGAAIGIERELSDKPAGLRTNMLICVGSTLITMTSLHVALTYAEHQVNIADPGRIAAQIVSGIGFLGAGTIIQARGAVHGLTTAATIWVMAGVGLAIGAGSYAPALATTVILLGVLVALGWVERHIERPRRFVHFSIAARREPGLIDTVNDLAEKHRLRLPDLQLKSDDGGMRMTFAVTCTRTARDELIEELLELDAVEDVRVNE
ncbi:MAG TPA: MgtC/SapB family protein [Gemmatimonadota bacterium]|nr:MgtC/SapB family protein [Gemmatimonadota bacterium]